MSAGYVLFCNAGSWRVARVGGSGITVEAIDTSAADLSEAAAATAEKLSAMDYDGRGVCLALCAEMVLADRIDAGRVAGKSRRQAMCYRFEDRLPVDIERLTVDFIPLHGGRALAVGVEKDRVAPIVAALADRDVPVAGIFPADLLALRGVLDKTPDPGQYVILAGEDEANIFAVEHGRPARWHRTANDPTRILRRLEADRLEYGGQGDIRVTLVGEHPGDIGEGLSVTLHETAPLHLAAATGAEAIDDPERGWVDLGDAGLASHDPLRRVRLPLNILIVLVVALPGLLAGMFYLRALKYDNEADRLAREQITVFRDLYPDRGRPGSIRRFLRSEWLGRAAVAGNQSGRPRRGDALVTMRECIAGLPDDLSVRVNAMRVERDAVIVRGEVKSYADVDRLRGALENSGFAARDRGTEKAGKVVIFDMEARYTTGED